MVLVDRNWRCDLGEVDLVLRDGDTLVFCEVKTRTSAAYGHPLEAVGQAKYARLRRLAACWLGGARRARARGQDRPGRGAARRAGRGRGRARAGRRLMVATTHTVSLQGAIGHVVDVQVDLSDGLIGTALVGRPDTSITEARDRCRAAVMNSGFTWPNTRRTTILLSPADLPKRGPHFDLAIAVAVLAAADKEFPRDLADGGGDDRRAHPGRPDPLRPRGAADDDGRCGARHRHRLRARAADGRGGDGRRRCGSSGSARWARSSRCSRASEIPEAAGGGADVRLAAAHLARRGAARGPRHGGRAGDGGRPLRRRGRGRRRPPPDAHRTEGVGQDHAGRADPGPAARPGRRRVPRADRRALPVRGAAGRSVPASSGRRSGHPTTRPRAPASSAVAADGCAPAR